jgi:hypothetical protein
MVETSYVTDTISQTIVFNSAMQSGGTLTFSVQAHNGGGNAGTNDTANVKILFYNSGGSLLYTAATNYSRNLAIPNGYHGVDPSVPWTNLSITATDCGGSCANVAYAKVQMVGIDGSYWAGDYGPYYMQPVLSYNGGANILYNPEFGTGNGTLVQGWTSTPGWGVCQGAYGGSNACSTNYGGVTANMNEGGYSATGGTTAAAPGGYVAAPVAPTVTSTNTTNSTKTIIVGGQQQTVTTPTTVTTYSNGTSTTTNGNTTTTTVSNTAFTGVHFGASQVADTQWNVYACLNTSSCQIYSTSPGGSYNTGSWTPVNSNQYITFIPNTGGDNATYPWIMILVNSDGTFTSLGSCYIAVQGVDSNGNIYLFVTNANYNGTLLSGNLGLTGQGVDFSGTQNPTPAQTNTLAGGMSATPLAAGQTGGTGGAPAPTVVSTSNSIIITTATNGATVNTYNQPVTITTWSDGSTTTANNGSATLISSTITGAGGGTTTQQQNDINAFNNNAINGSGIYIQQRGNNDIVNITQIGTHNLIGGVNQQAAVIQDSNNNITIKQGNGNGSKNEIDLKSIGGSNNINITQSNSINGISAGDNYQKINVNGFSNNITTSQTNDGGLQGHFAEIDVTGNYNTVSVSQSNNTQKQAFVSANGNNNTIQTTQSGTGAHYVSVTEVGNGNSAVVNQSGSTANTATITLTNAGAPASVNLTQTGGQSYSVQQTCYTTCGTITVKQGN